jgi:hypothetical protein
MGDPGRALDRLVLDLGLREAKGDVTGDRGVAQVDVLRDIAEIALPRPQVGIGQRDAVDADLADLRRRPRIRSMRVVLPERVGPMMPTVLLAWMVNETFCTAGFAAPG